MRTFIHILVLGSFLFVCTSCEDWLNVQPKTEIKSDMVFDKPVYFEQALIGVYLSLAERDLYGEELTFYFMDVIAGLYDLDINSDYYKANERDYQDPVARSAINGVWSNAYNAVVNINNLLENIEKQSVVPEITAKMIKGEALGLRAFLHFDLLRMFGPAKLHGNAGRLDKKIIPYVLTYDKQTSPQLSVSETLEKIHADLDAAISLLDKNDPWGENKLEEVSEKEGELFYQNRKFRFNYWAAIAVKARVLMWEGSYEEALVLAEKFITKSNIQFIRDADLQGSVSTDRTFSREYIFGLEVHNLYEASNIKSYFGAPGSAATKQQMYVKGKRFKEIYETGGIGSSDFRQLHRFAAYEFDKILCMYEESKQYGNRVSVIRKPEMYYIAAECLYRLGVRKGDAMRYLEVVRRSRTLIDEFSRDLSDEELFAEIQKEYYKDFFGEGQLFYFQKRLGMTTLPYTGKEVKEESYILPIPQAEIDFGRIPNTKN